MKSKLLRNYLILFCLIIVACSYKPPEDPNARPGTGLNIFPLWMDNMLGAQYGYMYSSELPIIKEARVYQPVENLGQSLVHSYYGNEKPPFNFHFQVVDLDIVNAFALPGGNVYVFRGLIDTMDNEAELAGVMSHEMGHTVARHGTKNMSKGLIFQSVLSLGTAMIGREHSNLATIAYIAGSVGLSLQMLKYSRDYEREADWIGIHNIARAGYDPSAMITMFQKIEKKSQSDAPATALFLSTHPAPAEREKNAQEELAKITPAAWKQEQFGFSRLKAELKTLPPAPKELHGRPVLGLTSLEAFGSTLVQAKGAELQQEFQEHGTQTVKVFVPSNEAWIDTGIILQAGWQVDFQSEGEIQLSTSGPSSTPDGTGAALQGFPLGAAIGALKTSTATTPFQIGRENSIQVNEPSRLYLGINDADPSDNSGWYEITTRIRHGN